MCRVVFNRPTTGAKSWALRYRHQGAPAKLTLGPVAGEGALTLAAARRAAADARCRPEQAIQQAPNPTITAGTTVAVAAAMFIEKHARKTRPATLMQTESIFNRLVLPVWGKRPVTDIRRRDVIALIERIADERGGYMSNRTLGVLSKFFNWLVGRDVLVVSPAAGVERTHQEQARKRVLDDDELRALWLAAEGEGAFGAALRVLALTGQRKNEVCLMTWGEINEAERVWVLPASRAKNGVEHKVPLSDQAWDVVNAMPRFADNDHVFAGRSGRGAINGGWAKAKTRLSTKAGIAEKSWRIHDLRRTTASGMQKLGVPVPVIETALNHKSGTFRGIVGTYQQYDYGGEVRIALQRWADRVDHMVGGSNG